MNRYGGIVLAGGRSTRLGTGRDKAAELLGGKMLLELAIELLSGFADDILVVGRNAEEIKSIDPDKQSKSISFVKDIEKNKGPLGGIFTGLVSSPLERNLVIACDMPFLTEEILQSLVDTDEGQDAVILTTGGMVQPLVGIYGKICILPLKEYLDRGDLAVHRFLGSISTVSVDSKDESALFDIDSPDDLEEAYKRLRMNKAGQK